MFICHLYIFFGEVSFKVFGPFCIHFVLVCGLSSDSLYNVFHKAEVFNFNEIQLISFMDYAFGIVSKKASPYPRSFRFPSVLSSRSFIVLHFTVRSMIHFELIFVKDVIPVSGFVFYMWISGCSSTIC